ncbi:unnamed protein product [Arabidopsis halleri]
MYTPVHVSIYLTLKEVDASINKMKILIFSKSHRHYSLSL